MRPFPCKWGHEIAKRRSFDMDHVRFLGWRLKPLKPGILRISELTEWKMNPKSSNCRAWILKPSKTFKMISNPTKFSGNQTSKIFKNFKLLFGCMSGWTFPYRLVFSGYLTSFDPWYDCIVSYKWGLL